MNNTFNSQFDIKVVNSEEERQKLTHLTSYAFLPAPADLTIPQKGFESIKNAFIQSVYPKGGDFPVATATCNPMTQNVRGKIFRMGGVEAVATQPEYRKQGIIKQLMINILYHAKESGEVFSTLFPFKESFYAKFGYISFPQSKVATINLRNLASVTNMNLDGTVKHYNLETVFDQYYNFTVEMQNQIHGMSIKSKEATSFSNIIKPSYVAFAYTDNKITGCLVYTTRGHSQPLDVQYMYYENANAKYLLLQFLARHIDQFTEVNLPILPGEVPELWLNDLSLKISTRTWSSMGMGRIIDVESLKGMFTGSGSITVKITDQYCPWNEGLYSFISTNDRLNVVKHSNSYDQSDCTITIEGLSALIYGGYTIHDFLFKNWISDYSADCFDKLQTLFPMVYVHMHEHF